MLRRLLALAAAALTIAATPPAALAPYINNGRFEPGDYGWMRGAFTDASPEQRAAWRAIEAWRRQCYSERQAEVHAELAAQGVNAIASDLGIGEGACGALAYVMPRGNPGDSWPAFQAAVARARPVAQAIIWSAALAQTVADPDEPDVAALLVARPTTDQVLRSALSWDGGAVEHAPLLDPAARAVAEGLIWLTIPNAIMPTQLG